MEGNRGMWWAAVAAVLVIGLGGAVAYAEETAAQAGEKVGIEGTFVRVAENAEGWLVLGYETANEAVGKEWILLDVGMTLQKGVQPQTITRDQIRLVTPDDKVLPLPSQEEFMKARGEVAAMTQRDSLIHESINYFPPGTDQPCALKFFADSSRPASGLAYDQVELNSQRACIGRLYFQVPGGLQLGNYNFDVKFANSILKVPMQIMTKEEAKEFEKKWKEAVKEAKHKN